MNLAATLTLAALAVAIEACVGYPQSVFRTFGHPVTWIGRLIALADRCLNHEDQSFAARRVLGFLALLLLVALAWGAATLFSLGLAAWSLPRAAGFAVTALIASSLIAQRSLDSHVLAVAEALDAGLEAGRASVAKIVGRDVANLDETGVARAAIESLAENFSDGVVSARLLARAWRLARGPLLQGHQHRRQHDRPQDATARGVRLRRGQAR